MPGTWIKSSAAHLSSPSLFGSAPVWMVVSSASRRRLMSSTMKRDALGQLERLHLLQSVKKLMKLLARDGERYGRTSCRHQATKFRLSEQRLDTKKKRLNERMQDLVRGKESLVEDWEQQ